ncbi:hypothetical protein COOONC_11185 [Cooperia oncophora]
MDDTTRYKILQYHDGTRTVLALGESPDNNNGFLPPAKNLFKMRWNCALEEEARKLTENCPDKVPGSTRTRTEFLSRRCNRYEKRKVPIPKRCGRRVACSNGHLCFWELMLSSVTAICTLSLIWCTRRFTKLVAILNSVAPVAQPKLHFLCIYNTNVPLNTKLYEIGSTNQTIAGCAWDDKVCEHLQIAERAECDDLLCKLPYKVQNGFL